MQEPYGMNSTRVLNALVCSLLRPSRNPKFYRPRYIILPSKPSLVYTIPPRPPPGQYRRRLPIPHSIQSPPTPVTHHSDSPESSPKPSIIISPSVRIGQRQQPQTEHSGDPGAEAQGAYSLPWGSLSHTCDKLFR